MKKFYLIAAALVLQTVLLATENTWDKREACGGSKRERAVGFVIGNRGYVALGQDTLNLMCNDVWEYDPGTNSWTQKSNFPGQARRDAVAFTVGNKAYVGTGINNADAFAGTTLSDFYCYDPVTNNWTSIAPLPGGGVYYASAFAIGTKGYVCCGKLGASYYSNQLWEYTPSSNTWTSKATLPAQARYGGVAFVLAGKAYFGTGTDENVFTQDFYRYDPALNTWTPLSPFPGTGRFNCSSFTANNRGYILFGSDGGYKDEVWMYDPNDDQWYNKAAMPGGARRSAIAWTINNRAYAGTGKGLSGTRRDFWEYTPSTPVGIDENNSAISSIYPQPANDEVHIRLSSKFVGHELTAELYDISGRKISAEKVSTEFTLRNEQEAGMYMLRLLDDNAPIATQKIIFK